MAESSVRRLSLKVNDDDTPSFLRKTIATAVKGNEALRKWKELENSAKSQGLESEVEHDNSPNRARSRANSIFKVMAPGQLKPRQSLGETDDTKRKVIRALGSSTVAFDKFAAKEAVERVPLYHGCSARFLEAVAPKLHSELVEAGNDIMVEGEIGDCMYILSRGDAELIRGEEVVEKYEDGAVFGEYASISKNPALTTCPWTVRATSLCDVKTLHRDDVLQALSHFREDANLLEKRVEHHIEEMQRAGAMPAKKEWWQIRRHSTASNTSTYSEKVFSKPETGGEGGLRSAVGRALTGIKLARRFSVGGGLPGSGFTKTMPSFAGVLSQPQRRMSDSMLSASIAQRLAERQNSKSSQLSMQSIQEREGVSSSSASSSVSSDGSSVQLSEDEVAVDCQASHSIRVLQAENNAARTEGVPANLPDKQEQPNLPVSSQSQGTVKIEEAREEDVSSPSQLPPSLASIERSLSERAQRDASQVQESGEESPNIDMATIKLPAATVRRRVLTAEEQRQRDVALHPFNQGGHCGGFPVRASQHGIDLAHMAALRVCHKAPINGAAARHSTLVGQVRMGRPGVCQPTVASKSRSWRGKAKGHKAKVGSGVAPTEPSVRPMKLWQEFLSRKAAGII